MGCTRLYAVVAYLRGLGATTQKNAVFWSTSCYEVPKKRPETTLRFRLVDKLHTYVFRS